MNIAVGVKIGIGKAFCDDSAIVGTTTLNDQMNTFEIDAPCFIGLADGVGGNSGGRDASLFVVEALSNLTLNDSLDLNDEIKRINSDLVSYSSNLNGKENMATTLSGLCFYENRVVLVHVGNTRIYSKRGSYLKQLTADHTTYQWLLKTGQTEAAESCNKNEIVSCLGGGNADLAKQLEVRELPLENIPRMFVITTDGIHDHIEMDDMESVISADSEDLGKITNLIELAEKNGSNDDKSMIIIRR